MYDFLNTASTALTSLTWTDAGTIVLAGFAFVQYRVLKQQTKIQEQNVKVTLLQQRFKYLEPLDEFIIFAQKNTLLMLTEIKIGLYTPEKLLRLRGQIITCARNSRFLFDESISAKLLELSRDFDVLITSGIVMANTKDENKLKQLDDLIIQARQSPLNVESEKKIIEDLKQIYPTEFGTALDNIQNLLNDPEFMNNMRKYLDVQQIGKL